MVIEIRFIAQGSLLYKHSLNGSFYACLVEPEQRGI